MTAPKSTSDEPFTSSCAKNEPNLRKLSKLLQIKELTEENANLRKENDNLKRILMRYENPHTPPSRRIYPTRNGDHNKSTKRFPADPKDIKATPDQNPNQT